MREKPCNIPFKIGSESKSSTSYSQNVNVFASDDRYLDICIYGLVDFCPSGWLV